ncbi:MAG TPA: hypothetical protein DCY94_01855 [Firmicutes bacterium]|nr:hypothetical protein [Bacillota bacterium]
MIRKYEDKYREKIIEIGKSLGGAFDIDKVSKNEVIFVYIKDGEIVGFIDYMPIFEVVEILYIAVDNNHRRSGIGSELISYVLDGDEIKRSILEVRSDNKTAIDFYTELGYKPVRLIKNYCTDGEDALAMEKVK